MRHPGRKLAIAALWLAPATAFATPDEDFAMRASHPDVVFFEGFDDQAAVRDKTLPDSTEDRVTFSTEQRASGEGSIRFEILSNSWANAGNWRTNFAGDNYSIKFRSGDDLYIQWRQRFSAEFLATVFETTDGSSGGWKQVIVGEGDYEGWEYGDVGESSSCTPLEVVVNNGGQRAFPQTYHNCGDYAPYSEAFASEFNNNDFLLQNAVFNPDGATDAERYVLWSQTSLGTELPEGFPGVGYHADEWMTFQLRISPGPLGIAYDELVGGERWGFTDSTVEMWVARDGEPAVKTHSFSGTVLQRGDGDVDTDEAYGKIWLTPYHTNKDAAHTHPDGYTWYDELIVSRSRIADPGFPSDDPPPEGTSGDSSGGPDSDGDDPSDSDDPPITTGAEDTASDEVPSSETGTDPGAAGDSPSAGAQAGCSCTGGRSPTGPWALIALIGAARTRRKTR